MNDRKFLEENYLIQFEGKKDGFSQNQNGVCKITITIQPDDMPWELLKHPMGQRYDFILTAKGDNEEPLKIERYEEQKRTNEEPGPKQEQSETKTERGTAPKNYAQQAALLVQDPNFKTYLELTHFKGHELTDSTDATIKFLLGIDSKTELVPGTDKGDAFKLLQRDFLKWNNLNERNADYAR